MQWHIADLERVSLSMWNATEEIEYDGWILRFAGGYSGRANSVQTFGTSTLPLEEKVTHCEAMYAERNIPILFKLTSATQPPELDSFLRHRGYTHRNTTSVQLVDIANSPFQMDDACSMLVGNAQNGVFPPDLANWMIHAQRIKNFSPQDDASHQSILAQLQLPTGYGMLVDSQGRVVAIGICAYDPTLKLCGVFDIGVHPEHQRQGYGRKITTSLIAWGKSQGATNCYLQVDLSNQKALPLYAGLGFRELYRYWYLQKI